MAGKEKGIHLSEMGRKRNVADANIHRICLTFDVSYLAAASMLPLTYFLQDESLDR